MYPALMFSVTLREPRMISFSMSGSWQAYDLNMKYIIYEWKKILAANIKNIKISQLNLSCMINFIV